MKRAAAILALSICLIGILQIYHSLLMTKYKSKQIGNLGEIWLIEGKTNMLIFVNGCYLPERYFVAILRNRQRLRAFCSLDVHVANDVADQYLYEFLALVRSNEFSKISFTLEESLSNEILQGRFEHLKAETND